MLWTSESILDFHHLMQGYISICGQWQWIPSAYMFHNSFGVRMLYGVRVYQPKKFSLVWPEFLQFWCGYITHDTSYYWFLWPLLLQSKVTLWPMVSQPVSHGVKHLMGPKARILLVSCGFVDMGRWQNHNYLTVIKIWHCTPEGACNQNWLANWSLVVMWL
jgi:hypothetical protein